jgi:hypothetical protein
MAPERSGAFFVSAGPFEPFSPLPRFSFLFSLFPLFRLVPIFRLVPLFRIFPLFRLLPAFAGPSGLFPPLKAHLQFSPLLPSSTFSLLKAAAGGPPAGQSRLEKLKL